MKPAARLQPLLVFAFAALWRTLLLLHHRMIDTDAAYYGAIARFFAAGHWERALDPLWPPFYPLLVSVPVRIGLPLDASGILVSILAGTGGVICCYLLAKVIAGPRVAMIAAVVAAVHPRLVVISQSFLTESLYVLLAGAALTLFVHSCRTDGLDTGHKRLTGVFLTGLTLSFVFLTKPEGIGFLVLLLAVAIARAVVPRWRRRVRQPALRAILWPLLLAVGFLIASAPYFYDVSRTGGSWVLGEKGGLNFYLTYRDAYRAEGIEPQLSDFAAITGERQVRKPGDYRVGELVRRRPGMVVRRVLLNTAKALLNTIPVLMYGTLMPLVIIAILYRRRVPRSSYEWLFGAWILVIVFAVSPFFLMKRFFVAALPPLIVWSAIGIEELRHRMSKRVFAWSAVIGVAFACAYASYSLGSKTWPMLYKDAGVWLKDNAEKPVVVAGRKPEVSFYAESEFRPLNVRTTEELEQYLRAQGITHLVAEDYIMPSTHPGLAYLIDAQEAPAWLHPVFSARKDGHSLVLYEYR
jgi:4-amino-4-deoxy-L-arabinose transferase-like glycosyltransferase